MSGLSRSRTKIVEKFVGAMPGLVDPTVDLTQPGGPFPYGEAILSDGAGGWTIAPPTQSHFFEFAMTGGAGWCERHGIASNKVGLLLPFPTNLIAISASFELAVGSEHKIQVVKRIPEDDEIVIAELEMTARDGRKAFRRDLSEEIKAGEEIAVRVLRRGDSKTMPRLGFIGIELES